MVIGELEQETEILVIGGGPGGYAAAFRAADLGKEVTMVNMEDRPGGECLFRGCIPSKTLLFLSELMHDASRARGMGISFGEPVINLTSLRDWKNKVIDGLADGLVNLCQKRDVQLIKGRVVFESSDKVRVQDSDISRIKYKHAILATGSSPAPFPGAPFEPGGRVMDSAGTLELADIPESLLVFGGGYIALELGSVYASLGSRVTLAVRSDRLLRGADPDLVAPLIRRLKEIFEAIHYNTLAESIEETEKGVKVHFEGEIEQKEQTFDRMLIAIGRRPNSQDMGLENTGVRLDARGFVIVDEQQRTADKKIFAIGDVAGGLLLAHKALREGKVAAETIAGEPAAFDVRAIPAVVYTDPQIAWAGLTEEEAKSKDIPVRVGRYPWKFSSRAVSMDTPDGLTKMIFDPETERILGIGFCGRNAEGMISEGVLAIEMGALAQDVALTIHPHPTLSETVGESAELFLGSVIHMLPKKSKK